MLLAIWVAAGAAEAKVVSEDVRKTAVAKRAATATDRTAARRA
jgi:hypothetical protein